MNVNCVFIWDVKERPHLARVLHLSDSLPPLLAPFPSIAPSTHGHLWIPTPTGLHITDASTGSIQKISATQASALIVLEDLEVVWVGTHCSTIEIYDMCHFRLMAVVTLPPCTKVASFLRPRDGSIWARMVYPRSLDISDPGVTFSDVIVIFNVFRSFAIDMTFLCRDVLHISTDDAKGRPCPKWKGLGFAALRGGGFAKYALSDFSEKGSADDTQILNSLCPLIEVGRDVWSLDRRGKRVTLWHYDETELHEAFFGGFATPPAVRKVFDVPIESPDVRVTLLSVVGKEVWVSLSDRTIQIFVWPSLMRMASIKGTLISIVFSNGLKSFSLSPSLSPSLCIIHRTLLQSNSKYTLSLHS